ncbi:MAG: hypothetical protein ABR521_03300 [Gaiellaceae bacterium]
MSPLRLVVLGTLASNPYAGMAWMHMQIALGLRRLGHDAYYMETTSAWPYDPVRECKVADSDHAVPYLARVAESFRLGDRWAYRRSFSDKAWLGPCGDRAEELLRTADAVLNVAGSTQLAEEGLEVANLVYLGTDPVFHEIGLAGGDPAVAELLAEHHAFATYGENIGTPASPIPPLPGLRARTRQPVLLDLWRDGPPTKPEFTTVANWKQEGRDVELDGETYFWSKDREFLRLIDLPRLVSQPIELATNLAEPESIAHGEGEPVPAFAVGGDVRALLAEHGWLLRDARRFTMDPWTYRDYVRASRAELSVARDLNVRLRSGWFSERSACYLAAGRPVVAQDTGFGTVLPTGEGLLAFTSAEEAAGAVREINRDYDRHSRAAAAIAAEFFAAEKVLPKLLEDLGL